MIKATAILGAWAILAALPSAASACDEREARTFAQSANAHGLAAPYMAAPPRSEYSCAAEASGRAGTRLAAFGGSRERKADAATAKLRTPARTSR